MSVLRVAGTDAGGLVNDVIVVDSAKFDAWVLESVLTISARWPGGVYVLDDGSPVGHGWKRVAEAWVAPVTPRHEKIERINAAVASRIEAGVPFKGARVSCSLQAQVSALSAWVARASLPYPFRISTIDDTGSVSIDDASDIIALIGVMGLAVNRARADGATEKDGVA